MSTTSSRRRQGRRWLSKRTAAAVLVAGVAVPAGIGAIGASAAVPTFPNNLVVFPDRDFLAVEGYQDHIGETALIEVTRGDRVIGSAKSVVAEGDVAFEVNHPGGVCWGNETDLNVTPDIRPGDKVTIKFDGDNYGDTTVQDTYVTADPAIEGSTVTVKGLVADSVNRSQMEQRIINPDLVDTAIGRRDVRALPGPLTPSDKGGYASSLTFDGRTFTATYVFDNAADAQIAAGSDGARSMAWEQEDADGNRQGLTIAEFGEAGGPGMGGCPAGPGDAGAPAPGTAAVVRSTDKTSLQVSWAPAEQVPTAEPVSGYSVEAIASSESGAGEHVQIGRRTSADATRTTITGLSAGESYEVEVRSLAGAKMSEAFSVNAPAPAPDGDITPPKVTATPAVGADGAVVEAKSVKLESDEAADIYYTSDGSAVISAGLPTDAAQLYTGEIPISVQTELKVVVFDGAGNATLLTGTYKPPVANDPAPAAPTDLTGTAGQESVSLRWSSTDTTITGYGVQAYNAAGDKVGALRETTAKNLTITGLEAGTEYFFAVAAKNAGGYGAETAKLGLTPTKVTDRVTIGTARWKTGDFRVTGTGSVVGAIVRVHPELAGGGIDRSRSLGSAAVVSDGTATGGAYSIRLRDNAAPRTNPGRIYVESDGGGIAGPFAVANG